MKTQPTFAISRRAGQPEMAAAEGLETSRLSALADSYLLACDIERHSERTLEAHRDVLKKLRWFLNEKQIAVCDVHALRGFLHHVSHGHKDPAGRWGSPRNRRPTKPGTVKTYHRHLRAFFNWLVREEEIAVSPMAKISAPEDRADQVQPFSLDQVRALVKAAQKSNNARRDEALLLLLFDTGLRASEVCSLRVEDVDMTANLVTVRDGKGGKARYLHFERETKKSLYAYQRERGITADDGALPMFAADRGTGAGGALTRHGLRFLFTRLGKVAGITGVRCSPHTMRHTFAVETLRAGMNVFTLKMMLGHENLVMTNRYVALAQADVTRQHAQFSPVARLRNGGQK